VYRPLLLFVLIYLMVFFLGSLKIIILRLFGMLAVICTAILLLYYFSAPSSAALSIANRATFTQIKPLVHNHCDNESLHTVELEADAAIARKGSDGMIETLFAAALKVECPETPENLGHQ
jgi:hypothetical protein